MTIEQEGSEELDTDEVIEEEEEVEEQEAVEESSDDTEGGEQQSGDYDARAQRMGWVPKDKFRGDPSRWVDAKQFVERGESELPILRERLRNADEQLKELGELKETVKDFRGYMTKAEERAYKRARAELEDEKKAAKDAGDFDRFEAVDGEIKKLDADAKPAEVVDDKSKQDDPMKDPVYAGWSTDNQWFGSDPERTEYANSISSFLNRTMPHLRGRAFLDEVSKRVKKEFPDRFENPRRNGAPRVEGGGNGAPRKGGGGRTYNDLPADAKAQCDRYVKQGVLKKEEYVRDYEWE
jgi:hypothetical protein